MYLSYFGLREKPFSLTPDPRFLFLSARHREALAHLLYGIATAGGFVQLTGEVGTGKTTLCRSLLEQAPGDVDVALILNPRQTPEELVASLCDELRISYPSGSTSIKMLVDLLNRHLLQTHASGRRTVLVIDEAQALREDALEQVRLLTNLETATEKLLQIILIGQPELRTIMGWPELRQLSQRITARYHLEALSRADTADYVRHRLSVAGCDREVFSRSALRRVHRVSGGIPRFINVVCDRALLGAYALQEPRVEARTVHKAFAEVAGKGPSVRRRRAVAWAAAALALAALAAGTARLPWQQLGSWAGVVFGPGRPATTDSKPDPAAYSSASGRDASHRTGRRSAVSLGALLETPGVQTAPEAALTALFGRWSLSYRGLRGATPCGKAETAGLLCLRGKGLWEEIRSFNRPAVLRLVDSQNRSHDVVLTGLADGTAWLDFGGREVAFPVEELQRFWQGQYFAIVPKPPVNTLALREGSAGADVLWLRAQVDRLQGLPAGPPAEDPSVFDAELRARVERFQRSRSLKADGIVGTQTLAHLSAATVDPSSPLLLTRRN